MGVAGVISTVERIEMAVYIGVGRHWVYLLLVFEEYLGYFIPRFNVHPLVDDGRYVSFTIIVTYIYVQYSKAR